jgi:hypothetical protein
MGFFLPANSINNQKTINPMARGGKRPGAGCPRGSAKKKANIKAAIIAASSLSPLDVMRDAMATFVAQGKLADAVDVAKAMAPYIHPKVPLANQQARPHSSQDFLPGFGGDGDDRSRLGKKEIARDAADRAGEGTDWGDDLATVN